MRTTPTVDPRRVSVRPILEPASRRRRVNSLLKLATFLAAVGWAVNLVVLMARP